MFAALMRAVTERPVATIAVVGALALAGLGGALTLQASDSTSSLLGGSSGAAKATDRFHQEFGDEAVRVLVSGPLDRTLLVPENMADLIRLEGCLSGRLPDSAFKPPDPRVKPYPAVCRDIKDQHATRSVYGPGTFVNTSAAEIGKSFRREKAAADARGRAAAEAARKLAKARGYPPAKQEQLARDAMKLAQVQFQREILRLAIRYGISSIPSADNQEFVSQLVFDPARGASVPKARFAYLFPSSRAAIIHIRLEPGLSDAARDRALDNIRSATSDSFFRMDAGQRYVVTGVPAFAQAAASAAQSSIYVLLAAAVLVMAATLLLVFRSPLRARLLPLALALAAAALTYGALALAGHDLTIASVAALPVLIGLAVDYAIQLQARFDEARVEGLAAPAAARAAAGRGVPTIAGAALATAAGFLILLLSPVSVVHGFAVVVIIGIALALACAVTAGLATLTRVSGPRERPADLPPLLPRTRATLARARDRAAGSRAAAAIERPPVAAALVAAAVVAAVVAAAVHVWWLWLAAGAVVAGVAVLLALLPRARRGLAAAA